MRDTIDHYREAYAHAEQYVREEIADALDAVREALAYDPGTDPDEALWEYADSCQTVNYTARAALYCLGSPNDGAYLDEMGEQLPTVEQRAMYALVADVREHPDWDEIGNAEGGAA